MATVFPATDQLPTLKRLGSPFFGSLPVFFLKIDCLFLFLLSVVSTCVLFCLVLLMDGVPIPDFYLQGFSSLGSKTLARVSKV